jgi:hypothetical protein
MSMLKHWVDRISFHNHYTHPSGENYASLSCDDNVMEYGHPLSGISNRGFMKPEKVDLKEETPKIGSIKI